MNALNITGTIVMFAAISPLLPIIGLMHLLAMNCENTQENPETAIN
jgi:hypothetical protein